MSSCTAFAPVPAPLSAKLSSSSHALLGFHIPRTGTTDMYHHTQHTDGVLEIKPRALCMLSEQNLLAFKLRPHLSGNVKIELAVVGWPTLT